MPAPLILFVPGMKPKPEPPLHREQLLRCLLEGLRRVDPPVSEALTAAPDSLTVASWTHTFYGEHRDLSRDLGGIEALLAQQSPTPRDIAEACAWPRRLEAFVRRIGDRLPFLIPRLADENMQTTLAELRRYFGNEDGIAGDVRAELKAPLASARDAGRPVLVIGHSLGSVIAWDSFWELSREEGCADSIDLFLTLGSPLGQHYVQRRVKGAGESGERRYPANIRRWANVVAAGDLTALDRGLRDDYADMLELGLVEEIVDHEVFNHFRPQGELDVHSEYGYLVNETTAGIVADWWSGQAPPDV